jgi:hypothetical protein
MHIGFGADAYSACGTKLGELIVLKKAVTEKELRQIYEGLHSLFSICLYSHHTGA